MGPPRNIEFYSDWLRPLDLEDGLFVRLTDGPNPICLVVGFSRPLDYLAEHERVEVMSGLVPHLQQALRTRARLGEAVHRGEHLAEALALHRHGIVVIGPELLVLETNPAADRMLAAHDGLLFENGRISATRHGFAGALHRAAHVALTGNSDGVRTGMTLLCQRASGRRPYVVHVLPLQRSAHLESPVTTDPAAMIVIIDPDGHSQPPMLLLRRLYKLTKAEAEVAVRIVRGTDARHIAEELCVSIPTVRTHIQHVYDKTHTHRQAELIRLLLTIAP
jgi:DNA-binding CsgD family transcriptional regulator